VAVVVVRPAPLGAAAAVVVVRPAPLGAAAAVVVVRPAPLGAAVAAELPEVVVDAVPAAEVDEVAAEPETSRSGLIWRIVGVV